MVLEEVPAIGACAIESGGDYRCDLEGAELRLLLGNMLLYLVVPGAQVALGPRDQCSALERVIVLLDGSGYRFRLLHLSSYKASCPRTSTFSVGTSDLKTLKDYVGIW